MTAFRPCIDLHQGKVKQIVGGTLTDAGEGLATNFVSPHGAAHFADLYRRDGLTIGELAHGLGVPEYRLRRIINGGLGHRNFAAYLNSHRLAEAKAALADPGQAEVPVLTIALDAGFGSLGPFNRAFKAETGLTPTAFRRAALAAADAPLGQPFLSPAA